MPVGQVFLLHLSAWIQPIENMNPRAEVTKSAPEASAQVCTGRALDCGRTLLAVGFLLFVGLVTWLALRRYQRNAYRRQALARLEALQSEYRSAGDLGSYAAGINALLKSVALVAYPRRTVAPSNGDAWLEFLHAHIPGGESFDPEFVSAAYRKTCPDLDADRLYRAAQNWIRRHEVSA